MPAPVHRVAPISDPLILQQDDPSNLSVGLLLIFGLPERIPVFVI